MDIFVFAMKDHRNGSSTTASYERLSHEVDSIFGGKQLESQLIVDRTADGALFSKTPPPLPPKIRLRSKIPETPKKLSISSGVGVDPLKSLLIECALGISAVSKHLPNISVIGTQLEEIKVESFTHFQFIPF